MGRYGVWMLMAVLLSGWAAHGEERKDEGSSGALRLETERAVIFKDGYALLVKRAEAVADARGTVFTEEVPENAVLGTFWAWSERGPAMRAMRAEWVEQEVDKEERGVCSEPAAILVANPGKRVTVELEGASLTGTVLPVPAAALPVEQPRFVASRYEPSAMSAVVPSTQIVALSVPERGTVVLSGRDIRRVEGPKLSLECKRMVHVTERRKRLSLDFGAEAAGKNLSVRIVYFTPGLRWIPTYRLDLKDGGKGSLALQAELVNELEDLRGTHLDLVVGVPNFRFRDVSSPLSLEGVVRQTLSHAAPSLMNSLNLANNATFSQNAGQWDGGASQAQGVAQSIPEFGGRGESPDFFIHSVPAMVLPKGARAVVPLWKEEVPVRDLYTLDVQVRRDPNSDTVRYGGSASSGQVSPLKLARGEVWHQLELKNETKYPLTTGPVLVMRGQVPQAQELLTYTPRGGSTLVPLTIATDVRSLHEETELERKQNALTHNRVQYASIHKKGTLALANPRGVRTPLRIRLSTGGKVEQVSDGGRVKLDDSRTEDWGSTELAAVNTHSDVEWTLTLEPGERRTLTYEVGFWR
ncbi:hypothetical protein BO221_08900 [Archangium sp. Cb G35]|uniref:hypothetical protein n=1 Tax=Archangium sp. Cb G35 TaxID=1920190 RepID=UPI000936772A|nr:hypothetical protein [Archangium sp. Cb G35]OJT25943.1 hypothetical protein BO221_08900 [Archangium sp. Cb G35]